MTELRDAGPDGRYGPATPLVRRVRTRRPNRRGPYDFTAVCVDALRAHVRRYGGAPAATGIARRFSWSPAADALTVCTVVCAVAGAVRMAAG